MESEIVLQGLIHSTAAGGLRTGAGMGVGAVENATTIGTAAASLFELKKEF
jgi:hypothetical protein